MDLIQHLSSERLSPLEWRRSSFSQGADQTCVDVAFTDRGVLVRDSKDASSPALLFSPREWRVFLLGVRAGEFDVPAADVLSPQPAEA